MVVGILLGLGVPDHFLGVDTLAIDDGRDLPVGAACIKADAAAIQMTAHGEGGFIGLGTFVQGQVQDLKVLFVELVEEIAVEAPLAFGTVSGLQLFCDGRAAADIDPETADGPQQELYITLHKAVVCLFHFGSAVNVGVDNGDLTVVALNGDGYGLLGALQVAVYPHTEGNKAGIQLRDVIDIKINA